MRTVPRVLILYASTDGQTARIAERIGTVVRAAGYGTTLRSAEAIEALWEIDTHDAVIVGGGVRFGRHPEALAERVRASRAEIEMRPNAFFSVCLGARAGNPKRTQAEGYIADFSRRTGWQPGLSVSFAGALLYRRYNPVLRFVMKLITAAAGGDTDTSRDHEYTDWSAVERFAEQFAGRLAPAVAA